MAWSQLWSQAAWVTTVATVLISVMGRLGGGGISVCSGQLPAHSHQPLKALRFHQTGKVPQLPVTQVPVLTPMLPLACPMEETSCVPTLGSHSSFLQVPYPLRTSPLGPHLLLSPGDASTLSFPPHPHLLRPLPLSRTPASLRPGSPSPVYLMDPDDLMSVAAPLQTPLPRPPSPPPLGPQEPPLLPKLVSILLAYLPS